MNRRRHVFVCRLVDLKLEPLKIQITTDILIEADYMRVFVLYWLRYLFGIDLVFIFRARCEYFTRCILWKVVVVKLNAKDEDMAVMKLTPSNAKYLIPPQSWR